MGAITGALAAFTGAMDAIKGFLAWKQDQEMQELGQLRQENVTLKAENESLRQRLAAVMSAPTSGKL